MRYPLLRGLGLGCLSIAAACLAGCNGYPSEDLPLMDVFSLSPAQRLERLNQLGQSPSAVDRWRYSLGDNCALAVGVRGKGAAGEHKQVGLRQKTFTLAYRSENAAYDVRADAHAGALASEQLFSGKDRGTALEVTLLVKLLARDCLNDTQSDTENPADQTI